MLMILTPAVNSIHSKFSIIKTDNEESTIYKETNGCNINIQLKEQKNEPLKK